MQYTRTAVLVLCTVLVLVSMPTALAQPTTDDSTDESHNYYMIDFTDGEPPTDVPWPELCDTGGHGDCPPPVTGEWWTNG